MNGATCTVAMSPESVTKFVSEETKTTLPRPEGQPIGFQREIEPVETPQGFQVRERIRNGLFALRPLAVGRPRLFGLCAGYAAPAAVRDLRPRQQAERQKNR